MADKTLYDILELSRTASDEAVRAAYERLDRHLADHPAAAIESSDASLRRIAVREAFLTLGNPIKRRAYDDRLRTVWHAPDAAPFWTVSKVMLVLLALGIAASYVWHDRRQQQALAEVHKATAAQQAAETAARAEAERLRVEREVQAAHAATAAKLEERQRRARDIDLQSFEAAQRARERESQASAERERIARFVAEAARRQEAQRAAAAAERQVARDKAELCRLERARYGRALSC